MIDQEWQVIKGIVPSKSNGYRIARNRLIKSDKVKEYERAFILQYRGITTIPHGVHFGLQIDVYYPNMKSDLDGCLKVILDLLQSLGAIENDKMCAAITARKFIDKSNPRVEFKISSI